MAQAFIGGSQHHGPRLIPGGNLRGQDFPRSGLESAVQPAAAAVRAGDDRQAAQQPQQLDRGVRGLHGLRTSGRVRGVHAHSALGSRLHGRKRAVSENSRERGSGDLARLYRHVMPCHVLSCHVIPYAVGMIRVCTLVQTVGRKIPRSPLGNPIVTPKKMLSCQRQRLFRFRKGLSVFLSWTRRDETRRGGPNAGCPFRNQRCYFRCGIVENLETSSGGLLSCATRGSCGCSPH